MLLTLTTTHEPATDLGYLLHKHPDKHQVFSLPFGNAHVFYPEAGMTRCTAALILEVDPVALVRGGRFSGGDGLLDQYVNDRPYAASSFLSVAIRRVLGSALGGRCDARADLAEMPMPLAARLTPLRCRGGLDVARALFEPLGYRLDAVRVGESVYWDVTLSAATQVSRRLSHLYVLIPVLDDQKHYWVADDEIEKLLHHGEGWLASHPARDLITRRYLKHQSRLTRLAIARLQTADGSMPAPDDEVDAGEAAAPKQRLHNQRLDRVAEELKASGAASVLDLGCGSGKLLVRLLKSRQFTRVCGVDACSRDLEAAALRLHVKDMTPAQRERIELLHGALTYRDPRIAGFDAAAIVEVIEHIDPARLDAFADAIFGAAHPKTIVLTTPNAEYNARYEALEEGEMRHADHRFEWTRIEFADWARGTATKFRYHVRFEEIGETDTKLGASTQMAIFTCI